MAMPVIIIVMATIIIFVATDVYTNFTKSVTKFATNCGASLSDDDACHHHHGDRDHFNRMRPNNNEYDVRFSNILTVWLRKSYVLSFCPKSLKLRTGKCDSRYFLYLLCVSSIEFGNIVAWQLVFLPLSKIFDIRCFQHAISVVTQL